MQIKATESHELNYMKALVCACVCVCVLVINISFLTHIGNVHVYNIYLSSLLGVWNSLQNILIQMEDNQHKNKFWN
jgi:hypothetical protein